MRFPFKVSPQYNDKHNYLVFCNDVLVSILKYVDAHELASEDIVFKNEVDKDYFIKAQNDKDQWQDWLIENGYKKEMYSVYYKHTFFSLVSDYCNYMYESIHCAAKMKVAVAYALLRKTLKDNLGFIEWLFEMK